MIVWEASNLNQRQRCLQPISKQFDILVIIYFLKDVCKLFFTYGVGNTQRLRKLLQQREYSLNFSFLKFSPLIICQIVVDNKSTVSNVTQFL